jgi:hypothetical protein
MSKKKFEFDESDYGDDWTEYRKSSKKKVKHRDNSDSWKFNPRKNYMDDYDDNQEFDRKARDW